MGRQRCGCPGLLGVVGYIHRSWVGEDKGLFRRAIGIKKTVRIWKAWLLSSQGHFPSNEALT